MADVFVSYHASENKLFTSGHDNILINFSYRFKIHARNG